MFVTVLKYYIFRLFSQYYRLRNMAGCLLVLGEAMHAPGKNFLKNDSKYYCFEFIVTLSYNLFIVLSGVDKCDDLVPHNSLNLINFVII